MTLAPFANEPILELRRAPVRERLLHALGGLDASLPIAVPVLIGDGERAGSQLRGTDPGRPDRVVAASRRRDRVRSRRGGHRGCAGRGPVARDSGV